MTQTSRRHFLTKSATLAAVSSSAALVACGDSNGPLTPAQFLYGVASGDPLADRVMLWTHAKRPNLESDVNLTWQVATDNGFTNIVKSGTVMASIAAGNTAKVDATGLTAGTTYYYKFTDETGAASLVGTTRTLPALTVTSVKFAVFSCTLYSAGFFNVYESALSSGAEFAVHLGDYIYEYGSDPAKFGNTDATTTPAGTAVSLGRVVSPTNDIVSLTDYRTRYALYRSDPNLQALHAKMPWITVWDDHEFTNNAYATGAQNHNTATQGDWATRKATAAKVYHEWMPIRTPDVNDLFKIYRKFDFGTLFSLHMVDTRIEGRTKQVYGWYGDPLEPTIQPYAWADYTAGLTPVGGVYPDAANKMMSDTQFTWLTGNIAAATTTWQIMGNQDIMAKLWYPATVVAAFAVSPAAFQTAMMSYLTLKATNPTAAAAVPKVPINMDSWDGYPIYRETLLQTIRATGKKFVTLSGDSHNAWFNDLRTLNGATKVGVEFATTSVTAPGYESAGLADLAPYIDGSALAGGANASRAGLIDDVNYVETKRRGYLLMTVTATNVKGEYVFVDNVRSKTYTASVGKTVTVNTSMVPTFS
ncbi:alkaline phosphatase D family protein [Limnohabitans sp.]|jgi:alkaline phosphatase D|uniref:alkaline phosphatase D family protein n=1 Tax=Limnohabitans sp. TaxID=1907725 RepID=UPI002FDEF7F8